MVFTVIKEELISVLILHLLSNSFQRFMCFKLWVFFVLVNDLYIGDPLEANKTHEICIFQ